MKRLFISTLITLLFIPFLSGAQFGNKKIVKIKAFQSFDKVYAGTEFKIAVIAQIDSSWHINSNKPYDKNIIPTELKISADSFELKDVYYPEAHDIKLNFSEEELNVWEGKVIFGGIVKVSEDVKPGNYRLIVNLRYQACNDISCLPPMTASDTIDVSVVDNSVSASEINQEIINRISLDYSNAKSSLSSNEDPIGSALGNKGLFIGLILVFLGGLALNLTPCVYPLIPITIGYFGGQSEGNTKRLFLMGLLFVLGMALTYSIVGVITALSGAMFGALLQNTYVIILIVLTLLALSLSMFGLYEFKLPDSLVQKAGAAKAGYFGAFFMGLTMGIVAAPCIGPFVLGLVTYVAAKGDPLYGFLMFFVLALGLGMPYLFLAMFSGKLKKLPRSGDWMDAVKHIFGFILIGMALYFLLPLLPKSFSGFVLPVFMILVAIYLLAFDKLADHIKGFKIFKIIFSVLILLIGVYFLIPSDKQEINWENFSSATSLVAGSQYNGTVIDFYADWCIPCKELDDKTFNNPKVVELSKKFKNYKADMTKSLSAEVEELRNKYNIVGVPTVLILDREGNEVKRITGFIEPEEFYALLSSVK